MRIPDNTVNRIYESIDILDVVRDYVPTLKKNGRSWKALSPFSKERTPSFFVVEDKDIFKCFSTGKGGDAVTFIKEMENCGYREALTILAAKYGIELPEDEVELNPIIETNRKYMDLCEKWIHKHTASVGYMEHRSIDPETAAIFHVGYAGEDPRKFGGLKMKEMVDADIFIQSEDKTYYKYDRRIIFPFFDRIGRPIGFTGRSLGKDGRKYVNSTNTPVFKKSHVLYGLHQAKRYIRSEGFVILVEGQMDVLGLFSAGVKNVVAASGTSLTPEQASILRDYTDKIVIMYDGDSSGQKAMIKAVDVLIGAGFLPEMVMLEKGEDPDSMRKKDDPRLILKGKRYFLDYYLDIWRRCSPQLKPKASDRLFQAIAHISDPMRLQESVAYVSGKMGVSDVVVMDKVMKKTKWKDGEIKVKPKLNSLPEYQLLHVLTHFPAQWKAVREWIGREEIKFDNLILDKIREVLLEGRRPSILAEGITAQVYAEMCANFVAFNEMAVKETCRQFRNNEIDKEMEKCGDEIIRNADDEKEQAKWYKRKSELIREKYELP